MPLSRSARVSTFAPRSWPSRPTFAIRTRIGRFSIAPASIRHGLRASRCPVRLSRRVVVESFAALAAQFARGDHPAQQRARAVLIVAKASIKDRQNIEADVEAN